MTERKYSHREGTPEESKKHIIKPEEDMFSGMVFLGINSPGLRMTEEGMLLAEVQDPYKESLLLSPVKGRFKIENGREDLGEDPDVVSGVRIKYNLPDGDKGELLIKSPSGVKIASKLQSRISTSEETPKEDQGWLKRRINKLLFQTSSIKEDTDASVEVEVGEPLLRIPQDQTVLFYKKPQQS